MEAARKDFLDILLIDTAGRVSVDDEMMAELKQLYGICMPTEVLFVIDAMVGQDALESAKVFSETVPISDYINKNRR